MWEIDSFMASFYEAVDADTETDFDKKRVEYKGKIPGVFDYLDVHW
ncbi:hypothetical protein PC120_g24714 [Phytophthora cactorum]|nr:hypothetical protein PC120_g24714 [Phytophthora cactorum]